MAFLFIELIYDQWCLFSNSMVPKLYKTDTSPPVRAVYLAAKALDVTLEYVEIDLLKMDHLKPEFTKLNPQHTIPTLVDEGKVIWDSHAINIYLVSKYGKDDSLYPQDIYKRAVVNQRLHFDSGVLFPLSLSIGRHMFFNAVKTIPLDLIDKVNEGYEFMEKFLEGHQWAAGDTLTLADFSLLATITTLDVIIPIDETKYPNIIGWIKRGQQLPYYSVNQKGIDDCKATMKMLLS